jgi:hypothetical protein
LPDCAGEVEGSSEERKLAAAFGARGQVGLDPAAVVGRELAVGVGEQEFGDLLAGFVVHLKPQTMVSFL